MIKLEKKGISNAMENVDNVRKQVALAFKISDNKKST